MIGISAGIWAKPGPLPAIKSERVRTVPYLTERVLSRQPRLARLGALAAVAARFESWFGGADEFEVVDAEIGQVVGRVHLRCGCT